MNCKPGRALPDMDTIGRHMAPATLARTPGAGIRVRGKRRMGFTLECVQPITARSRDATRDGMQPADSPSSAGDVTARRGCSPNSPWRAYSATAITGSSGGGRRMNGRAAWMGDDGGGGGGEWHLSSTACGTYWAGDFRRRR
ncbi:hypothetical protein AcW2_006487 [Taiwanofungus camphoratus]|nr:hypothetical protein AcW2_006487 [Antrodia cinnamomea]